MVWESFGSAGSDTDGFSVQGQRYDSSGTPLGGQFQVNTYTTNQQHAPSVGADGAGNFVVVWESFGSAGSDTDGFSVQGQRYDSSGTPLGGQFQVNTYTTSMQQAQRVTADGAGNFVVVWESFGSAGSDTDGFSVQGQRYDSSGTPLGGQFQVNTYTTSMQRAPSVGADGAGNFVVVWESFGSAGSDTDGFSVQGQRYDSSGTPLGGQFQVNTYTTSMQQAPSVGADGAGNFVVVWESFGSAGSDTDGFSVQGQRYDSSGTPLGGQFQVNTYTTSMQQAQRVTADGAGNFVVVWESFGSAGSDTDGFSVQGQRYDSSGTPLGGQFQVNTYTTSMQRAPSVGADGSGNFVVVWESFGSAGSDTDGFSVQGQRYDSSGTPLGGQFQVNTYTTSMQQAQRVTADGAGNFVVVWESFGSAGSDTDGFSVQGQRYDS